MFLLAMISICRAASLRHPNACTNLSKLQGTLNPYLLLEFLNEEETRDTPINHRLYILQMFLLVSGLVGELQPTRERENILFPISVTEENRVERKERFTKR